MGCGISTSTSIIDAIMLKDQKQVDKILKVDPSKANEINQKGLSALQVAVTWDDNTSIARSLISAGADVNRQNKKGTAPLHGASAKGYFDAINLLLQHGGNINVQDEHGDTPMHKACKAKKGHVVVLLITKGGDPFIKNGDGYTVSECAVDSDTKNIISSEIARVERIARQQHADDNARNQQIQPQVIQMSQQPVGYPAMNQVRPVQVGYMPQQPQGVYMQQQPMYGGQM